MIPTILMAVGIADSVHILTIFFRELHHGKSRKESMIISLKLNLLPCFLTSITTSFGFMALLTSVSPPIRVLGVVVALGSIIAYVVTVTLLPALLTVLRFSENTTHHKDQATRWTKGLGNFVIKYRNLILSVTTVIVIIFSYFITQIHVNNNPVDYFKKGTYFRDAMDFIDDNIKGANLIEISIDTMENDGIKEPAFLHKVDRFQQFLETTKKFKIAHTSSLVDILKTVNRRLNQDKEEAYIIPDNKKLVAENLFLYTSSVPFGRNLNNQINVNQSAIRLTIRRANTSSEDNLMVINSIKEYMHKNMPEYDYHVTGRAVIFSYTTPKVTRNMVYGLIIALIVITVTLILTFRSISMGLLSLIPNISPLLMMFGLVGVTNTDFNMGLSMVSVIALGIVVDDTVHFLTKFLRSRRQNKPMLASIYQVFNDVGTAIIFTSIILTMGFGIFVFSNFLFNSRFGTFTAFTMVVALIMDIIFLPALLLLKVSKKELDKAKLDMNTVSSEPIVTDK